MRSIDERESLLKRLKYLTKIHDAKTKEYRKQHNLGEEVGCITREATIIASLLPKMNMYNITIEEIKNGDISQTGSETENQ